MTVDRERWSEVLAIEERLGPGAMRWVAEQIVEAAIEGDEPLVERLSGIASRLAQLRPQKGQRGGSAAA